ncbi:MAG: cell division protein FtsQ [Lachnospiraceae bacterium]|nr:cell division protein FtsQ [Lachnospiraceae bacterium]
MAGKKLNSLKKLRLLVVALCVILVGIAVSLFISAYRIDSVRVEGSTHYSTEEIKQMVFTDKFSENSVILSMKYRNKSITDIPFIERMDVSILDNHSVKIEVYEKALAGYVECLGNCMYFDKDGIVVESSRTKTPGVTQVTGLKFDYVILHEPLPVENEEVFQLILDTTQLLNKYELTADKIFFDADYNMTLYFGDVRVILGSDNDPEIKVMQLPYILPTLEGKKGTLDMSTYTEESKDTIFTEDSQTEPACDENSEENEENSDNPLYFEVEEI